MDGVLLQDWTTLRAVGVAPMVQTEDLWLDADDYGDLVFFLEVADVVTGGGTSVLFAYETAPSKDESYFIAMDVFDLGVTTAPWISRVLDAAASVPPSRWVRWKMSVLGSPSTEWGATFRLHVACNRRRAR